MYSLPVIVATCLLLATPATAQDYAVVVHESIPVKDISMSQLRAILLAKDHYWPGKKRVRVYLSLPGRGLQERSFLLSKIYRMSEQDLGKHWVEMIYRNQISSRPKELPNVTLMLRLVDTKPGAFAIVAASHLPEDGRFRVLTVDGKALGSEGYPLREKREEQGEQGPWSGELEAPSQAGPVAQPAGYQDGGELQEIRDQLADVQLQLAMGPSEEGWLNRPLLDIHGFSHVTLDGTSTDANHSDSAALGGLDLFVTSQLSSDLSFLNETVFEPNAANEYTLDVERLILKWTHSDALNIQAGRFHTTIGVWNESFHHGEWLQTSVGRPRILRFEDDGGALPIHLVGLVVKGRQRVGPGTLDYTAEFGNGRGRTQDPPQIIGDANDSKAVNLAFGYSPESIEGLRVGGGVYVDTIPPNAAAAAGPVHGSLDEVITSVFGRYESDGWDILSEFFSIQHDGGALGDATSEGFYVQAGRRFGACTPYVRYDTVAMDGTDTYFDNLDDVDTIAAGLRWDWERWAAIKLQFETSDINLAAGGRDSEDRVLLQVSFAF